MGRDDKVYSQNDLEETVQRAIEGASGLIINRLQDEGLLKDDTDTEPGTFKKFAAGMIKKVTKHIDAVVAEGESALITKSVDDARTKSLKREREAFEKHMKEKYGK